MQHVYHEPSYTTLVQDSTPAGAALLFQMEHFKCLLRGTVR